VGNARYVLLGLRILQRISSAERAGEKLWKAVARRVRGAYSRSYFPQSTPPLPTTIGPAQPAWSKVETRNRLHCKNVKKARKPRNLVVRTISFGYVLN